MPITSLIIGIKSDSSDNKDACVAEIAALPYVEVSDVRDASIVVITDTANTEDDQSTWDALGAIPGVLSTDIIYHNFEDTESKSHES